MRIHPIITTPNGSVHPELMSGQPCIFPSHHLPIGQERQVRAAAPQRASRYTPRVIATPTIQLERAAPRMPSGRIYSSVRAQWDRAAGVGAWGVTMPPKRFALRVGIPVLSESDVAGVPGAGRPERMPMSHSATPGAPPRRLCAPSSCRQWSAKPGERQASANISGS